jgi:hypothetical protein
MDIIPAQREDVQEKFGHKATGGEAEFHLLRQIARKMD